MRLSKINWKTLAMQLYFQMLQSEMRKYSNYSFLVFVKRNNFTLKITKSLSVVIIYSSYLITIIYILPKIWINHKLKPFPQSLVPQNSRIYLLEMFPNLVKLITHRMCFSYIKCKRHKPETLGKLSHYLQLTTSLHYS